jgi:hypothetical protein
MTDNSGCGEKHLSLVGLLAIILLFLPAETHAQDLRVEWDKGTDFRQFHTYTFAPAPYAIRDPDALLGMRLAVGEELESKGLRFVASQQKTYDVFVAYNAQILPDPQNSSRRLMVITVNILDSRNNVIWRAGGNVLLENDNSENRRNVRRMLAAMFQKYPPK